MKVTLTLLILCSLLALLSPACKPETTPAPGNNPEDPYLASPSSGLPTAFRNSFWFWGNSGPLSYFDHDGNEVGSATEAGRQYRFTEMKGQGRLEFEQYLGLRNTSDCITEIYTRKCGTVKFESENRFTFYPVTGSFKTIKTSKNSSCPFENSERLASPEDLAPTPVRFEVRTLNGEKLLYIFNPDTSDSTPVFVYQSRL